MSTGEWTMDVDGKLLRSRQLVAYDSICVSVLRTPNEKK